MLQNSARYHSLRSSLAISFAPPLAKSTPSYFVLVSVLITGFRGNQISLPFLLWAREGHDLLTKIADRRRTPTVDYGVRVMRNGGQLN
jgi:hypothetical protein